MNWRLDGTNIDWILSMIDTTVDCLMYIMFNIIPAPPTIKFGSHMAQKAGRVFESASCSPPIRKAQ